MTMVELLSEKYEYKKINETTKELKSLKEDVNETLIEAYLKENVTINGKKIDLKDKEMDFKIIENSKNKKLFRLSYQNNFNGLNLQEDKRLNVKINFEVIYDKDKQNYYIKFDTKGSSFDSAITVTQTATGTELLQWDVIYDITVPKERIKTTDIRIEANADKTHKRIIEKIENQKFESLVKIEEKDEFENTQITGLNKVNFGKEIEKETEGYSRSLYLYDEEKALYRPITKVYFDKVGKIDSTKTLQAVTEKNNAEGFKVLWEKLGLQLRVKDDTVQFRFEKADVEKLEKRVSEQRNKLIPYIDGAKVGPAKAFTEFHKDEMERPRHKGKTEVHFHTELLELNILNDTYTLKSWRKEELSIKFGFDFAENPKDDKLYIKDFKWDKLNTTVKGEKAWNAILEAKWAFDIHVDADNDFNIFDYNGDLTIRKSEKTKEQVSASYPQLAWDGAKLIGKSALRYYEKSDGKNEWVGKIEYYDRKEGKKIVALPASQNDKKEWELENSSENYILTDYLIDITKFDTNRLQKINLHEEDMKKTFKALMEKENIKLRERDAVKVLNSATGKYEYYTAKQKNVWAEIVLDKDKELYEKANKVMEIMKERIATLVKIEEVQLWRTNKWKSVRFEWAVGGGRGLEKNSVTTANKLSFMQWTTNKIAQSILWWEGEKSTIEYKITDGKTEKLSGTRFLHKKLKPNVDIQKYKVTLDAWSVYKLNFDPIE